MKITKAQLIKNLMEQQEFDEMAKKSKGVQAPRTSSDTGELKPAKFKPYWKEGNDTDIPDYWILNPTQIPGEEKVIVPTDCIEEEQFLEDNQEWLSEIFTKHNITPTCIKCTKTSYQPRSKKVGTQYVPTGEKYSEKESILRTFNPIVKNELTDKVNQHLIKCGLPPIQTYDNQAYVDKYSEVTNRRLDWESHDYDFYNSVIDFAQAAKDLITKGSTNVQIYRTHMPRQYNPGSNWSALRKTEKTQQSYKADPLTAKYKLPKRGYEAEDKDVAVCTTLHISGQIYGGQYIWEVKVTTEMGKKLKEEQRLNSGKYTADKNIVSRVGVQIPEGIDINNIPQGKNIINLLVVKDGLIEALNGVAQQILEINPKKELISRMKIQQSDITRKLNEDDVNNIIKDVINRK